MPTDIDRTALPRALSGHRAVRAVL